MIRGRYDAYLVYGMVIRRRGIAPILVMVLLLALTLSVAFGESLLDAAQIKQGSLVPMTYATEEGLTREVGDVVNFKVKNTGNPHPVNPEQKKTMRLASWSLSATVILEALMYSSFSGDYLSGVGGGIGLVFSVGLSFGTMYDERLGNIFSKAARNAFVVLVAAMSVVGFIDEAMWIAYPELMTYLDPNPLLPLLWMSYAVFVGSWIYHAYVKGE